MKEIKKFFTSCDRQVKFAAGIKALEFLVNGVEIDVTLPEIREAVDNPTIYAESLVNFLKIAPDTGKSVRFVLNPKNEVDDWTFFEFLSWAYEKVNVSLQKEIMKALRLSLLKMRLKIGVLLRYINPQFAGYIKELLAHADYEVYREISDALRCRISESVINDLCLDIIDYYIHMQGRLFHPIAVTKIVPALLWDDNYNKYSENCYDRACTLILQMFAVFPQAVSLTEHHLWECLLKKRFSKVPAENYQLLLLLLIYTKPEKNVCEELVTYLYSGHSSSSEEIPGLQVVREAFIPRLENKPEEVLQALAIVEEYLSRRWLKDTELTVWKFDELAYSFQFGWTYYVELTRIFSANLLNGCLAIGQDSTPEYRFDMFCQLLCLLGRFKGNETFEQNVSAALDIMLKTYQMDCSFEYYQYLGDIVAEVEKQIFKGDKKQLSYAAAFLEIVADRCPQLFENNEAGLKSFAAFCDRKKVKIEVFEEKYRPVLEEFKKQETEKNKLLQELNNL